LSKRNALGKGNGDSVQCGKTVLADIKKLSDRIEKGRLKDSKKIQRAIGRVQTKHPRLRRYYQINLTTSADTGSILQWSRNDDYSHQAEELCGCYVLRTDQNTLDEYQLWQMYISLTQAENGFKALKTDLGLRPNPHRKEDRVDAHVFVCILAYHLLRNILFTLEQKGDHRCWETIKCVLKTHSYSTIIMPTNQGESHRIRRAGQPEECQKAIYTMLGIEWNGLPTHQAVIQGIPVANTKQPDPAIL